MTARRHCATVASACLGGPGIPGPAGGGDGLLTNPISTEGIDTSLPPVDLDQDSVPDGALDGDWLAGLTEPDDTEPGPPEPFAIDPVDLARPRDPDQGDVPRIDRDRLLELNQQAAAFFTRRYRDS
jgi:hypothetical protein